MTFQRTISVSVQLYAALLATWPLAIHPAAGPHHCTGTPLTPSRRALPPRPQAAAATDTASAVAATTKDGVVLDPSAVADRRTAAEKRAEEHFLKYEEVRNRKAAAMSHRERIRDLNEKLSNLTEHNAIFNVSYT